MCKFIVFRNRVGGRLSRVGAVIIWFVIEVDNPFVAYDYGRVYIGGTVGEYMVAVCLAYELAVGGDYGG